MGVSNTLHDIPVDCSRCGVHALMEAQFKFGLQWMLDYRLGDTLEWERSGPDARPPDGNLDDEGYVICPLCSRDLVVEIQVRGDVIQGIDPQKTRADVAPDGEFLEIALGERGAARAWLGMWGGPAITYVQTERVGVASYERHASVEVTLIGEGKTDYGLLGCSFLPEKEALRWAGRPFGWPDLKAGDGHLHQQIAVAASVGPQFPWPVKPFSGVARVGLPSPTRDGVSVGAADAKSVVGPGLLKFDAAVYSDCSSPMLFATLARIVIQLVARKPVLEALPSNAAVLNLIQGELERNHARHY